MPKHESLAAALAAFQAELPKLRKDETAKVKGESANGAPINYTYGYADLAQVVEAVSTRLGQHGMAFTAFPTMADNGAFVLTYSLLHEGGEERTGVWPLPDPTRVKPQVLGSAITYARRYSQMSVTNTFPDKEDDDGAAAAPASNDAWANARPARRPAEDPQAQSGEEPQAAPAAAVKPPKTSWTDGEVMEQQDKMPGLSPENAARLYDWMAGKGLHERKVADSGRTATLMLALTLTDRALLPDTTPEEIDQIKALSEARGLLKVKVSANATLEEALYEARVLAEHDGDEKATSGPVGVAAPAVPAGATVPQ